MSDQVPDEEQATILSQYSDVNCITSLCGGVSGNQVLITTPMSILLWTFSSGNVERVEREQLTNPTERADRLTCSSMTSDGIVAMVCSRNRLVSLYHVPTRKLAFSNKQHDSCIMACSMSGTGAVAASGDRLGLLVVWDLQHLAALLRIQAHGGAIFACKISENGRILVTTGEDATVRVWNLEAYISSPSESLHCIVDQPLVAPASTCSVSRNGTIVACGLVNNAVVVFSTTSQPVAPMTLALPAAPRCIQLNGDGSLLYAACENGKLYKCQVTSGSVHLFFDGGEDPLTSIYYPPSSNHLTVAGDTCPPTVLRASDPLFSGDRMPLGFSFTEVNACSNMSSQHNWFLLASRPPTQLSLVDLRTNSSAYLYPILHSIVENPDAQEMLVGITSNQHFAYVACANVLVQLLLPPSIADIHDTHLEPTSHYPFETTIQHCVWKSEEDLILCLQASGVVTLLNGHSLTSLMDISLHPYNTRSLECCATQILACDGNQLVVHDFKQSANVFSCLAETLFAVYDSLCLVSVTVEQGSCLCLLDYRTNSNLCGWQSDSNIVAATLTHDGTLTAVAYENGNVLVLNNSTFQCITKTKVLGVVVSLTCRCEWTGSALDLHLVVTTPIGAVALQVPLVMEQPISRLPPCSSRPPPYAFNDPTPVTADMQQQQQQHDAHDAATIALATSGSPPTSASFTPRHSTASHPVQQQHSEMQYDPLQPANPGPHRIKSPIDQQPPSHPHTQFDSPSQFC
eukprot:m.252320 g.252320  ORF g.252320 m.252320 type:complete len:743 (-) comp15471_c1_seq1:354-2582(-)